MESQGQKNKTGKSEQHSLAQTETPLFYSVDMVAKQLKCSVRAVIGFIKRGILPPLPGNQKDAPFKIWPIDFWEAFYAEKAKAIKKDLISK